MFIAQAGTLEVEQLDIDGVKAIYVFNLGPYVADVHAKNYSGDSFNDRGNSVDFISDWAMQKAKSDADRLAEERKKEKEITRINIIENEIADSVLGFIDKHPDDKKNLKAIYLVHKKDYLVEISAKIGDHFRERGRTDDADYFYDLSNKGFLDYTNNGSHSSQGNMHLELYNREIAETKPTRPTASLYYHLNQAVAALSVASPMDEVAEISINDLRKIRNMIFRWHLSVEALQVDTYYNPGNLVKMVYARGFVSRVLKQAEDFKVFQNANCYDGSKSDTDLAKYLIDLGFFGVFQQPNQHNWVHPNGFMVRVKRIKGQAQFTIGLTFENPIEWNTDGTTPRALKQYTNGTKLVFNKWNEVLKLAYNKKAVFVVPAFRGFYWHNNLAQVKNIMMQFAHFPLNNGFGRKIGSFSYNTDGVKALLRF